MEKVNFINNYLKNHGYSRLYIHKILPDYIIDIIYKLYQEQTFPHNIVEPIICLYFGCYFLINNKNHLGKKYLLLSIRKGNSDAMNELGIYYLTKEPNYTLGTKYLRMGSENGNKHSSNNLGHFYEITSKDYNLMKVYYKKAIKQGSMDACINLGNYYWGKKEYEKAYQCYYIGVNYNSNFCMARLGDYYKNINVNEDLMLDYYHKAVKNGNNEVYVDLIKYYFDKNEDFVSYKYINKLINIRNVKILNLLIEYLVKSTNYPEPQIIDKILSLTKSSRLLNNYFLIGYNFKLADKYYSLLNNNHKKSYYKYKFCFDSKIDNCDNCNHLTKVIELNSCGDQLCENCFYKILKTNKCILCNKNI